MRCSKSETTWYIFHVGKGATCFTLVTWLRPLRGAQHRHHSIAQQSTMEPSTRDGTHWRQRFKLTRVFTGESRG